MFAQFIGESFNPSDGIATSSVHPQRQAYNDGSRCLLDYEGGDSLKQRGNTSAAHPNSCERSHGDLELVRYGYADCARAVIKSHHSHQMEYRRSIPLGASTASFQKGCFFA